MSSIISDTRAQAALVLADGSVFKGRSFGAKTTVTAPVTVNAAAMGYQEIITDENNAGKIIAFAYPHIGNTGIDLEAMKGKTASVQGLVIRCESPEVSHFTATGHLSGYLRKNGIAAIAEIDTRRLVRHLRDHGAQTATIVVANNERLTPEEIQNALSAAQAA